MGQTDPQHSFHRAGATLVLEDYGTSLPIGMQTLTRILLMLNPLNMYINEEGSRGERRSAWF